jgi:hypothetical protein
MLSNQADQKRTTIRVLRGVLMRVGTFAHIFESGPANEPFSDTRVGISSDEVVRMWSGCAFAAAVHVCIINRERELRFAR